VNQWIIGGLRLGCHNLKNSATLSMTASIWQALAEDIDESEGIEKVRSILASSRAISLSFGTFEHAYPLTGDGVQAFMSARRGCC